MEPKDPTAEEPMATAPNRPATTMDPLAVLFRAGSAAGLTDADLLQRFTHGSEEIASAAFAVLVDRHGQAVRRACRQILRDPSDADDAAQAVFLILARKAGSVRRHDSLSSWLFGVAVRVAKRSRAATARRRAHEARQGAIMARRQHHPAPLDDDSTLSAVAEELARLPDRLRAPLVACHLDGLSQEQAASLLRCPLRTLQRRLSAGRDRLRHRLSRRGLGSLALGRLDDLSRLPLSPCPPSWTSTTVRAALASSSGLSALSAGASSSSVLLARSTLHRMALMTSMKLSAVPLLLAASGAAWYARPSPESPPEPTPSPPVVSFPQADQPAERVLKLTVVDAESGEPIAGASAMANAFPGDQAKRAQEFLTDSAGVATIRFPVTRWSGNVRVEINKERYAPFGFSWGIGRGQPADDVFTARLALARPIGGRVIDEEGRPVANAVALIQVSPESDRDDPNFELDPISRSVSTDPEGRWRWDDAPPGFTNLQLTFLKPALLHRVFFYEGGQSTPFAPTLDQLLDQSAVVTLRQGRRITGVVLDDATGAPIAGATVRTNDHSFDGSGTEGTTDAEGRFRLATAHNGPGSLFVQAPGHAPGAVAITIGPDLGPTTIRLGAGKPLRGRVVNPQGKPIADARISVSAWRNFRPDLLSVTTGADGWFVIHNAPDDPIQVRVVAEGYMDDTGTILSPSAEPQTIQMHPPLAISGTVTDAETGQPIPEFRVIDTQSADRPPTATDLSNIGSFRHGKYALGHGTHSPAPQVLYSVGHGTHSSAQHVLWFVADGYLPTPSRAIKSEEGTITVDASLKRGSIPLREPVSGVLHLPDGSPAADANVYLATPSNTLYIQLARALKASKSTPDETVPPTLRDQGVAPPLLLMPSEGSIQTRTANDGSFRFPPQAEPGVVVALSHAGFAVRPEARLADSPLTLAPFGRVTGEIRSNGQPLPFAQAYLRFLPLEVASVVSLDFNATADEQGRFVIEQVPSGLGTIAKLVPRPDGGFGGESGQPIEVAPGTTTEVVVGGSGRPVVGRLAIPEGARTDIDFMFSVIEEIGPPGPEIPKGLSDDERVAFFKEWAETEAGLVYLSWRSNHRVYPVMLARDGTFRIDDMLPGPYTLRSGYYTTTPTEIVSFVASPLVVPEQAPDAPHAVLDLGDVPIEILER